MKLYQYLSRQIAWTANEKWEDERDRRIEKVMTLAPSGSGFDAGTKLDDSSTGEKIIFNTAFHHMNENGYYVGWTNHKITVKPSLIWGFDMTVSGRDKNGVKDYISDCFNEFLDMEIDEKTF